MGTCTIVSRLYVPETSLSACEQRHSELEAALLEADKRERELRADQNDLVEIQRNQGQVLNETTRQLDEAIATIEQQRSDLAKKEEEVEELRRKVQGTPNCYQT